MKKLYPLTITFITIITCIIIGIKLFAKDTSANFNHNIPTEIKIIEEGLHLGVIQYNSSKKAIFQIKNTGRTPLIIKAIEPSCGCTNVKWDKKPIRPDEITEISITFEPNSIGKFIKSIKVFCNTLQATYELRFDGEVIE